MRFLVPALSSALALLLVTGWFVPLARSEAAPGAAQILERMLEADPWGLSGAEVNAVATVRQKGGATRTLRFSSRSRRYDGSLSKGLVRVTEPADLKGVGLLQLQRRDSDDERHLFLPELKRARRLVGSSRGAAFVGTDFSYGDMDRKDLRQANAVLLGHVKLGTYDTFHLQITPTGADHLYAKIITWVRSDNFVPLKMQMFAASGALSKTLVAKEIQRVGGRWFITRSVMTSESDGRSTELWLEKVTPSDQISDAEFTVQSLERL